MAEIDLRVGGLMRTHYDRTARLGDENTIVTSILAFDPGRMLSLKVVKAPASFAHAEGASGTWSVMYLDPVDAGARTRLTLVGAGYATTGAAQKARAFFDEGNRWTLEQLEKALAKSTFGAPPPTPGSPSASASCAVDRGRGQLDFWLGTWDVATENGTPVGENRIERTLGGCAIVEHWAARNGQTGLGVHRFNVATQIWEETWLDNAGVSLNSVGRWKAGVLRYEADTTGLTVWKAGTLEPMPDGRVRQRGLISADRGVTWKTEWTLLYTRRTG